MSFQSFFAESLRRKELVYWIPCLSCLDCETVYIGETGRTLQKRQVEHKYAVKKGIGRVVLQYVRGSRNTE